MSKGASLAPQEIRIDFAVLPETKCQGLFNQFVGFHKDIFCGYTENAIPVNLHWYGV